MHHEQVGILQDFLLIIALSGGVVWVFHRIKLPPLVGFLAAGVLIGPGGFALIESSATIDLLAEIGIVLLLFSIGLEFSFKDLVRIRRLVLGGGGLQLTITTTLAGLVAYLIGFEPNVAVLWGVLIGLSSTAIVLNLLQKSGEISSVHGQGMLGILLFQDMAVVVLILLVPILGGDAMGPVDIALVLAKALGVVVGLWFIASYIYPFILERVVRTRQRELFTLVTILAGVGTAYLAGLAGLSLALGAFLGGLVISESPYSHHMLSEVLPFRDLFNAVFFVSVGMLFKPAPFLDEPVLVVGLILGAFALKAVVATGVIVVLGYGLRVAVLVGLGVAQVGEFSFILAKEAMEFDLLDPDSYSIFLAVSLVTMAATPLFFRVSDWLANRVEEAGSSRFEPLLAPTRHPDDTGAEQQRPTSDHVIIVGYGLNGRNVARVLRSIEVPYVIIEMNSRTVKECSEDEPIYFGDAARKPILKHLGIKDAHALVVAIGDAPTTRRIVTLARDLNPELYLVVRTRYAREVDKLSELGASEVIPEEFETSLALAGAVLESYGASPVDILEQKDRIRQEHYGYLRLPDQADESRTRLTLKQLIGRTGADIVRIPDNGRVVGQTLRELHLRARFGVSVVGILRDGDLHINPDPDWKMQTWDELVLIGESEAINEVRDLLRALDGDTARSSEKTD